MTEQQELENTSTETVLAREWSWWYSPRGRNSKPNASYLYQNNLTKLGDVRTLEDMFSYYCYLKKPSDVPIDHKMMFFRKGDMPTWEVYFFGILKIIQELARRRLLDLANKKEG